MQMNTVSRQVKLSLCRTYLDESHPTVEAWHSTTNGRQTIIGTKEGLIYWRINASLGLNELMRERVVAWNGAKCVDVYPKQGLLCTFTYILRKLITTEGDGFKNHWVTWTECNDMADYKSPVICLWVMLEMRQQSACRKPLIIYI